MIPFEYFAPPGESEVEVYGAGLAVKSAVALVDGPLTVEGVECLPFQTKEEEGVKKTKIQETPLPSLPAKIKVINPSGSLIYLRILMEVVKLDQKESAPSLKSTKNKTVEEK